MKNVTGFLVIILLLVVVLIMLITLYLYINRGNERIVELSFKSLLIPILIAFGLIIIEYLKPVEEYSKEFVVGLTDDPNTLLKLVSGSEMEIDQQTIAIQDILIFHAQNIYPLKNKIENGELIEVYLLYLLNKRFSGHWEIQNNSDSGFFDLHSSSLSIKNDAEEKPGKIELQQLKSKFGENHVIQKINSQLTFCIPSKTEFDFIDDGQRTLLFKSSYINLQIDIKEKSFVAIPHVAGKTAALIRNKLNIGLDESQRVDFYGYKISIEATPSKLKRSNPRTIQEMKWVKELSTYLEQSLSWDRILDKL